MSWDICWMTAIEVTPDGESEKTLPIGKSIDTASVQWDADAGDQLSEGASGESAEKQPVVDPFFDLSPAQPEKLPTEGLAPKPKPKLIKDPLLPAPELEKPISEPEVQDVRPLEQAP